MKNRSMILVLAVVLTAMCFQSGLAQPGFGQGPGAGQPAQFDPLMPLKRALAQAGAPELNQTQADQLTALITAFREQAKPTGPDETLQAAHKAYDDAILNGDLAGAQSAANVIAAAMAAHTSQRLSLEASFRIQALAVIKANDVQYAALLQRFGTEGVSRIIGGLFHAGFMRGPGGPGGGPGGAPGSMTDSRGGPVRQIRQ